MNNTFKAIIKSNELYQDKILKLKEIEEDLQLAYDIVNGKYKYCSECDDYYLTQSFTFTSDTKESKICVYEDYINSGGNEYADGYIHTDYEICPKGHKRILNQMEERK